MGVGQRPAHAPCRRVRRLALPACPPRRNWRLQRQAQRQQRRCGRVDGALSLPLELFQRIAAQIQSAAPENMTDSETGKALELEKAVRFLDLSAGVAAGKS